MSQKVRSGGDSFIDEHCGNCAVTFKSASQIFTKITIVDDTNCSKIQEITILDAILYIYGFSATNLATAFLDYEGEDHLFTFNEVTETSEYIIEHGLPLCSNCVSVFKQVYVAVSQLKRLSAESSVLNKTVKKFSPTCIKFEADPEENNVDRIVEEEDCIGAKRRAANTVRLRKTPPEKPTLAAEEEPEVDIDENLFEAFQFEQEYDVPVSDQEEDVKTDPLAEPELATVYMMVSSNNLLPDTENINDTNVNNSPPIRKHKAYRGKGRPRKKRKLIKTPKSGTGCTKLGRPKKSDVKSKPAVVASLQRPVSSKIHLTRRTASLLNPESKGDAAKLETKAENEETVQYNGEPVIKRVLTEEQKEKARLILRANMRRRKYITNRRRKAKSKAKKAGNHPSFISNDLSQENDNESNAIRKNDRKTDTNIQSSSFVSRKLDDRKKILKCSCGKAYRSIACLRAHERDTPCSEEPVICDICGESFKKNYMMYAHKGMNHSENPQIIFKCNICNAKYMSPGGLKQHNDHHHSNNSLICDKCGKSFGSIKYLRRHSIIHDSEGLDKELFRCKECGILLKHNDSLKKHIRLMHKSERTFLCPECGKTTKNMTNMRIHMRVHDPNRTLKTKPKRQKLSVESKIPSSSLNEEVAESTIPSSSLNEEIPESTIPPSSLNEETPESPIDYIENDNGQEII